MRPSPVRLEHYHLTTLSLTPVEEYAPSFDEGIYPRFADAEFSIGVRLGEPGEDAAKQFLVHLDLAAKPKAGAAFPYQFALGADAIVSFHGADSDPAKVRDLVLVNGASLLYGALREVLLTLTSRFPNGPLMLPSADFRNLRQEQRVP
jgi:preprotein translocase subunit SecB